MTGVTFIIPGKPFAKQRPRMTRAGHVFTPAKTRRFEDVVRAIAVETFPEPIQGPVRLTIVAVFCPAKSWSKRRRLEALGMPHTQKPDVDNIGKAICGGLNRVAFADDSQISRLDLRKQWGEDERTIVTVEPDLPASNDRLKIDAEPSNKTALRVIVPHYTPENSPADPTPDEPDTDGWSA